MAALDPRLDDGHCDSPRKEAAAKREAKQNGGCHLIFMNIV